MIGKCKDIIPMFNVVFDEIHNERYSVLYSHTRKIAAADDIDVVVFLLCVG
jgi:hypothetical protein